MFPNRLSRTTKNYRPKGRRNQGGPIQRLLDVWDQKGSTSAQLHDSCVMIMTYRIWMSQSLILFC